MGVTLSECPLIGSAASAAGTGQRTFGHPRPFWPGTAGPPSGSIDALAGGRCGAPTQTYTVDIDCSCGPNGAVITESRVVNVANGAGIRVDIAF